MLNKEISRLFVADCLGVIGIIDNDEVRAFLMNAAHPLKALPGMGIEPPAGGVFKLRAALGTLPGLIAVNPEVAAGGAIRAEVPVNQKMFLDLFDVKGAVRPEVMVVHDQSNR